MGMTDFMKRLFAGDRDAILWGAAGYFALMALLSMIHMLRLSRWPSVTGKIHEQRVERTGIGASSADEQEYEAKVRYSYIVDGVAYESDRLNPWLVTATHNLRALLRLQFRSIERRGGNNVTVYYNPGNPQKSYLHVPGWRS